MNTIAITLISISIIFLCISCLMLRMTLNKHYQLIQLNHAMIINQFKMIAQISKSSNSKEINEMLDNILKEL